MDQAQRAALGTAGSYSDRWLAYQQGYRDLPGVVAGIRYGDETLVYARGFADIDRREVMRPDHVFRIASHSKMFTAVAVMQLAERGALRLDDPVGAHVRWLSGAAARWTLRQLLNHVSGSIRDGVDADFWVLEHAFPGEQDLANLLQTCSDVLPANERFKYSNVGYSLLGLAVEAAAGVPYNDYVRTHIVERLGLPNTGPDLDEHAAGGLAHGYAARLPGLPRKPLSHVPTGAMSPATGFYSTASDLCRFAAALALGNEDLLSDASKRELMKPYWAVGAEEERYGLGFSVKAVGNRTMVGHGGAFPGYSSRTSFDPADGLTVTVLINESSAPARILAESIVKLIDFALGRCAGELAPPTYDGRFMNLWGPTDVARLGSSLLLISPGADDPTGNPTELEVVDGDTLRIAKADGYGSYGEMVRFERDRAGKPVRILAGGVSSWAEDEWRNRQ